MPRHFGFREGCEGCDGDGAALAPTHGFATVGAGKVVRGTYEVVESGATWLEPVCTLHTSPMSIANLDLARPRRMQERKEKVRSGDDVEECSSSLHRSRGARIPSYRTSYWPAEGVFLAPALPSLPSTFLALPTSNITSSKHLSTYNRGPTPPFASNTFHRSHPRAHNHPDADIPRWRRRTSFQISRAGCPVFCHLQVLPDGPEGQHNSSSRDMPGIRVH